MVSTHPGSTRRLVRMTLRAGLWGLLLLNAGCPILGAAAGKLEGTPALEAKFKPAKVPTLVFAENFKSPTSSMIEADQVARFVTEELEKNEVVPTLDPMAALNIPTTRPAEYKRMSIAAVGRELGARQVLYVSVQATQIEATPGTGVARGRGSATVKLIDVDTGDTLWPTELAGGYPVAYEAVPTNPSAPKTYSTGYVYESVQRGLAVQIARLFFTYKAD